MAEATAVRFTSALRCGADILTVRFERPRGYGFRAGQWFRLTLDTEAGPESRTFSHAGTPEDDWIELSTRLSDTPFKRRLAALAAGDDVVLGPSGGRLSIPDDATTLAFLAGGVGIAPFRSLLRNAAQTGRAFDDAVLLYGNRDATCEPYLSELEAMSDIGLRVVRVLEHPGEGWKGETGFITSEIVRKHAEPLEDREFFIAGPPAMVAVMDEVLDSLEVAADRRHLEAFGTRELPHRNEPVPKGKK